MARRQLLNYKMDVYRECKRQLPVGQIQQAIQDAIDFIDSKANWEFLIASANLALQTQYSTGTLTIANGSTSGVGTGTAWDPTWKYKDLRSASQMYYTINSFGSPTTLTLDDPFASPDLTNGTYLISQSRYALPSDCEGGRDICLKGRQGSGPDGRGWIQKIPRLLHEKRQLETRVSGNLLWYTDDELDESTNVPTIRLYPPPTVAMEIRVLYYKHMTKPVSDTDYIPIPLPFEKLIIHKAAAIVMERNDMKGWLGQDQHVKNMLEDMFDRYGASPGYTLEIEPDDGYSTYGISGGRSIQDGFIFNFN